MKMIALSPNCCPNQDAAVLIEENGGPLICPKCKKEIGQLLTDVGLIYVLSSEAFSGLHKIGFTVRTIEERLEELNGSTSLPHPFKLEMSILSLTPIKDEKRIHKLLSTKRVNDRREFFQLPLIDIHDCIVKELGRSPLYCSEHLAKDIARRSEMRRASVRKENTLPPPLKSTDITSVKASGILGVASEKPDKSRRRPLGLL